MSTIGTFEIEDCDIVRLDGKSMGRDRTGWVNVGAFALHIEVDQLGDIAVSAYPLGSEDIPLARLQATHQAAMAAGATDRDGGDTEEGDTEEEVPEDARSPHESSATTLHPIARVKRGSNEEEDEANARRLLAAWNACDGIDTDLLEGLGAGTFQRERRNRQELQWAAEIALEALDMLANACTDQHPGLAAVFNRVVEETGVTALLTAALDAKRMPPSEVAAPGPEQTEAVTRYYAVTGQVPGDDEDTLLLVGQHADRDKAVEVFRDMLREIRNCEPDEEIFVGAVVSSATPITE